jgi:HTH-type transcriptional regulator/antitoxin HigA
MMKMKYTIIRSKKQYFEYANTLEDLVFSKEESKVADEVDLLTLLIEDFDKRNNPDEINMDPIQIIRFLMEENGLKSQDIAGILGCGKAYVSLLLSYKRKLSWNNARILAKHFSLQIESLTKPYNEKRKLEIA